MHSCPNPGGRWRGSPSPSEDAAEQLEFERPVLQALILVLGLPLFQQPRAGRPILTATICRLALGRHDHVGAEDGFPLRGPETQQLLPSAVRPLPVWKLFRAQLVPERPLREPLPLELLSSN